MAALSCVMFGVPGIVTAGPVFDSFFDITYEITPASRGEIPTVTASLSTGEVVPLTSKGSVKFFNDSKGFDIRMTVEQDLGAKELVLISASCSDERCVITGVEQKAPAHNGHVTVLK